MSVPFTKDRNTVKKVLKRDRTNLNMHLTKDRNPQQKTKSKDRTGPLKTDFTKEKGPQGFSAIIG